MWKAGGFQALELARDRSLEIRYRGERWTKIPDWYLRDNPNCLDHSIDELKESSSMLIGINHSGEQKIYIIVRNFLT